MILANIHSLKYLIPHPFAYPSGIIVYQNLPIWVCLYFHWVIVRSIGKHGQRASTFPVTNIFKKWFIHNFEKKNTKCIALHDEQSNSFSSCYSYGAHSWHSDNLPTVALSEWYPLKMLYSAPLKDNSPSITLFYSYASNQLKHTPSPSPFRHIYTNHTDLFDNSSYI